MTAYYKILDFDRRPIHGGTGRYHPSEWMPHIARVEPCRSGYHACRVDQLVGWLGPVMWEAEYRDEPQHAGNKMVGAQIRLVRQIEGWNDRAARLFAADCAERVLPIFEAVYPDDARPRVAVETARRFAVGAATRRELDAALTAAAAARAAAWPASTAAAAARAAATGAAAWPTAATGAAAWPTAATGAAAARDAAARAAVAATTDEYAEVDWQNRHLAETLNLDWDIT